MHAARQLSAERGRGRTLWQVRLTSRCGYTREPSNVPGRPNRWVYITDGAFAPPPPDLRELAAHRSQHVTFLALVALAAATVVASTVAVATVEEENEILLRLL